MFIRTQGRSVAGRCAKVSGRNHGDGIEFDPVAPPYGWTLGILGEGDESKEDKDNRECGIADFFMWAELIGPIYSPMDKTRPVISCKNSNPVPVATNGYRVTGV